jgi:glutamyl-tRNA synthetase
MNGCYIRNLSVDEFDALAQPYYKNITTSINTKALSAALQPRIETLNQIAEQIDFLQQVPDYDMELYTNKKMKTTPDIAHLALQLVLPTLQKVTDWSNDNLFNVLKEVATSNELKNGQILYPVRIALSGKETTPGGATELAVILGKDESIKRIQTALQKLNG